MNKEQIANLLNHPKTKLAAASVLSLVLGCCIPTRKPDTVLPKQQIYTYQAEYKTGYQKSGNVIVPGDKPTWTTLGHAVNIINSDTNVIKESVVILGVMPIY